MPLYLLARFHPRGRDLASQHPTALGRLTWCLGLGLFRVVNSALSRGALNNWTRAHFRWDRELVLVTGGAEGIGRLLALLFAERGIKVVVMDVQRPAYDLGEHIHFVPCDLSSAASIEEGCKTLQAAHGNPTVVVNNAGLFNCKSAVVDTPDDRLVYQAAVNQLAHYRLARHFVPSMAAANHGMVVTTASLAGYVTPPGMTAYGATKAAAVVFHEGLTAELRDYHHAPAVRTVLVNPNYTRTKLIDGLTNDSRRLFPTFEPATVAEAIFAQVMSGESGVVVLPRIGSWWAMTLRSWPWWLQQGIMKGAKDTVSMPPARWTGGGK